MRTAASAVALALALAASLALSAALFAAPAAAIANATPRCMTKAEWAQIAALVQGTDGSANGISRNEVTRIVGFPGKVTNRTKSSSGSANLRAEYRQCLRNGKPAGPSSIVPLYFDNWDWSSGAVDGVLKVYVKGPWSTPRRL